MESAEKQTKELTEAVQLQIGQLNFTILDLQLKLRNAEIKLNELEKNKQES